MYKKGTKIIAGTLAFMLTMTNFSVLGQVFANSLESQTKQTNQANVEFDAYFVKEEQNTHSAIVTIGEENYLNTTINVKEAGYLKDATIEAVDANFKIAETLESKAVSKVEESKVYLNQIKNGNTVEIAIPIQINQSSNVNVNTFSKESKVKFTAAYVDGKGKENKVEKDITVNLGWTASSEAELNMQVSKFVPYDVNDNKGLLLQTVVQSYLKDNTLPVKENKIEISVPDINGVKPQEVRVVANSTKATNGDETGINFNLNNYSYNEETNILTITVNNLQDEQGNISFEKSAQDEFVVTYIYSEEAKNAIGEDGVKVLINASNKLTLYGASKTKAEKDFKGEVTLKDQINNLVDFSITTEVTNLSKGQIYANYDAQNKIETEYRETLIANIGLAEVTDKIILEKQEDNFTSESNVKSSTQNGVYYKTLSIDKVTFDKILGEEGYIKIYNKENLIATIDKNMEANEDSKFIVNLSEANINSLKIETSKPLVEGKIIIELTKAIKGDLSYTKAQVKEFNKLELNLTGKAINGEKEFTNETSVKEISLVEPTSQIELTINNSNLSTVVTNTDVKLTTILKTDTEYCSLYKDPTFKIIMPSYIENINVKNIDVLFETEGSKLTLKNQNLVVNNDGTKTLIIETKGTQTEYTLGAVSKGVNIVVTCDITINKLTSNKQDNIIVRYTNDNILKTKTAEEKEALLPINIVAPTGVVTTSAISNYADGESKLTSISGEEKTATIEIMKDAREVSFDMSVINNYNNTIDNISILGRTLFKGNKDIVEGKDLGSTMNIPLTSAIKVNDVDESKVKVYYSEKEDATKDLNNQNNLWTLTPEKLENVKSYLIVIEEHSMNTSEMITFTYNAQIPAKLQHNESAYGTYVVYFNNNLETGKVEDKVVAPKIGVTTGKGPVLEANIVSDKSETEEIFTKGIIKYTVEVKNVGTEIAQNAIATINIPESLRYVEPSEDSVTGYKIISFGGKQDIELGNIEPNKAITKDIYVEVGNYITQDTEIVEMKANISAENISGEIETNTVKNTIAKVYYLVATTILDNNQDLKEETEYTYYMEVLSSSISEERNNTTLEITLPQEIEYQNVEVKNKENYEETDITNETSYNYDSKSRKLTIDLGKVEGINAKGIYLNFKVGNLPNGVYDLETNIEAKIYGEGARAQIINVEPVQISKVGVKVSQTSNIPEGTLIQALEDFKYIITIENLSNTNLYNVKVTDILPKDVVFDNAEIISEDGNSNTYYQTDENGNLQLKISLKAKETKRIEINVIAEVVEQDTEIVNQAKIEYEGMDTVSINKITHTIAKYEINENKPTQTHKKRIMGQVWKDINNNGIKDEGEEKVSGVEVLLFNNVTGNLVKDEEGNDLKQITSEDGKYTFKDLPEGKYTVIFLYDVANYSATVYHKENVAGENNSDGVDCQITLYGEIRTAAITEEIVISDSNIYNIDLGLVNNEKFDLRLDKTVSKITVQDSTGTSVYDYKDTKLAKRDLVAKQINDTTIIVEYKIKVTNEGAISGYVKKIVDYMPTEMKFNSELNRDWYTSENGAIYNSSLANTLINPGETKEVTLTLTKKMTENNLGLYSNTAEIYEAYNDLGIQDIDSFAGNKVSNEDDTSTADVLITVKTGEAILFVGLTISIISIIGIGAYFIKRKVLR